MSKVFSDNIPANVKTFLALIMHTEGTDKYKNPYTTRFAGSQVLPDQPHDGKIVNAGGYSSTAVGAYQFLYRTWRSLHDNGNPPMTPAAQDQAAIKLLQQCGAYKYVLSANWAEAIKKSNGIWASLPGSPYGQPTFQLSTTLAWLRNNSNKIGIGAGVITLAALLVINKS